ncbi:MAG: ABC transporter permease subunit [Clostridiales bacterium]|nr:ABC transporter permease subunit [Clostridiales bacterium]
MNLTVTVNEIKNTFKTMLVWALSAGLTGLLVIVVFESLKGDMDKISEQMASMGKFAEAVGMDKLSIGTIAGYYATEVGTIHALASSMFAAILSISMLSKEEDGHTADFLFVFPASRIRIVISKLAAALINIILFNLICSAIYLAGVKYTGEDLPMKEFLIYHGLSLLMNVFIVFICFAVSAFLKSNKAGIGIGLALAFYALDMIARITPDAEKLMYLTPMSFCNAADIFSNEALRSSCLIAGGAAALAALIITLAVYPKRDLAG